MPKTIKLMETLNESIFDEMTETYPLKDTDSEGGREYEQTCSFVNVPSNMSKYVDLADACAREKINPCEAISSYYYLLSNMASSKGYWCSYHEMFVGIMAITLGIDPGNAKKIIAFLIKQKLVFIFRYEGDDRITAPMAVYTYECVQTKRRENREKKQKQRENAASKVTEPKEPAAKKKAKAKPKPDKTSNPPASAKTAASAKCPLVTDNTDYQYSLDDYSETSETPATPEAPPQAQSVIPSEENSESDSKGTETLAASPFTNADFSDFLVFD